MPKDVAGQLTDTLMVVTHTSIAPTTSLVLPTIFSTMASDGLILHTKFPFHLVTTRLSSILLKSSKSKTVAYVNTILLYSFKPLLTLLSVTQMQDPAYSILRWKTKKIGS